MPGPLHDDEIRIDLPLVRALVDRDLPWCAALPLRPLADSGSSNALFRLGDELLVRLPRQPGGTATIEKEAGWLPRIGPLLGVSVPEIVVVGEPGLGYSERWSVVRWIEGEVPTVVGPDAPVDPARLLLAADLAAVLTALGELEVPAQALEDPALRWYRGEALSRMDSRVRHDIAACRALTGFDLDLDAVQRVWEGAMDLPGIDRPAKPRWLHGDLLAENLLVRRGRLAAVLDFGGLCVGDATVDLVAAWEVLDAPAREVLRSSLGYDDATWWRGRAWALALAVMTFPYYWDSMPARCASRLTMASSVLADAEAG